MKATLDYCSLEMRNITPLENVRNTPSCYKKENYIYIDIYTYIYIYQKKY